MQRFIDHLDSALTTLIVVAMTLATAGIMGF
jgi:hypothetical protein